jgi:hypothetical protein
MKKLFIFITVVMLFLGACAGPEVDGSVTLDGPILESINREGFLEFNGVVVNSGDTPVKSVYVVMMLRDEDGKVIEATSTSVLGDDPNRLLYPSERAFFSISVKSDPQSVASKDVEIYYDQSDTDLPPSS